MARHPPTVAHPTLAAAALSPLRVLTDLCKVLPPRWEGLLVIGTVTVPQAPQQAHWQQVCINVAFVLG